jgi:hypothetical protein
MQASTARAPAPLQDFCLVHEGGARIYTTLLYEACPAARPEILECPRPINSVAQNK